MNLRSRATGPFAPPRLSQRALVIGCFSKLTPFMRPDVRIFYSRLLPLPGWAMRGREGKGRRWGANREIARVSSISRSLTPRFRSAAIILSKGGGRGKEREASFHDPVATLDNARIDDQPSQQKSWETERETNSTMHPRVYVGSFCEEKYLCTCFIIYLGKFAREK